MLLCVVDIACPPATCTGSTLGASSALFACTFKSKAKSMRSAGVVVPDRGGRG